MERCRKCEGIIKALECRAPKGWRPFAWGPIGEDLQHYHVFPDSTPKLTPGVPQELETTAICQVKNPVKREVLAGG